MANMCVILILRNEKKEIQRDSYVCLKSIFMTWYLLFSVTTTHVLIISPLSLGVSPYILPCFPCEVSQENYFQLSVSASGTGMQDKSYVWHCVYCLVKDRVQNHPRAIVTNHNTLLICVSSSCTSDLTDLSEAAIPCIKRN